MRADLFGFAAIAVGRLLIRLLQIRCMAFAILTMLNVLARRLLMLS
jgi:hypothetical protein